MVEQKSSGLPAIEKEIMINAPIDRVWNLATSADQIGNWFMPGNIKAELGHKFNLNTPFGTTPCEIIEVKYPHLLKFTWDTDGWIVSFVLEEIDDDHTKFTLIHDGWLSGDEIMPKANQSAKDVYDNMSGGWEGIVRKLKKVVEN